MKRIILPMLGLLALAACSKQESVNDGPVAIELSSGVKVLTKAPVTEGTFTAGIGGWESSTALTDAYPAANTWYSTGSITVSQTPNSVDLSPSQYYNANENIETYIRAWYPAAAPSDGTVAISTTDGSVDAMTAAAIHGNKNNVVTSTNPLDFKHRTAQLNFVVKKGEGLAAGTAIRSITLNDVSVPVSFDLTKEPIAVTAGTAADLTAYSNESGPEITEEGVAAGTVMVMPINSKTFSVDITTNNATYQGVSVSVETDTVLEGYAYVITLTISQREIVPYATVTPWVTGNEGGAQIY